MCDTCGCGITETTAVDIHSIDVMRGLMETNDHQARHNREHFDRHGVLSMNLMSSPGAGKTRLIEATLDAMGRSTPIMVIEGDLETENDAERIRAKGAPAVQITTGNACHLDAAMIHDSLHQGSIDGMTLLFIENVGNLVCPASFDLGQHLNVVLLSVTEGDDKPCKYPVMFRTADLVVLTNCDLLPVLEDFDTARVRRYIADVGGDVPVIETSIGRSVSIAPWLNWLTGAIANHRASSRTT